MLEEAIYQRTEGAKRWAITNWKKFLHWDRVRERGFAATQVQKVYQGYIGRRLFEQAWRKRQERRLKEAKRKAKEAERRRKLEAKAATTIQRIMRGRLAKRFVAERRRLWNAATVLARFWRGRQAWVLAVKKLVHMRRSRLAATRIQGIARQRMARAALKRLRNFKLRMRDNLQLLDRDFVITRYFQEQGMLLSYKSPLCLL